MPLILHVTTGLGNGGAEAALYRLVTADRVNAHRVVSLTGPGFYGERLREKGIEVHALGLRSGRVTPAALRRLFNLISRLDPDVVQTWMYHADIIGGTMARLAGKRAVVWCIRASDLGAQTRSRRLKVLLRVAARLAPTVPARIVCNSAHGAAVHQASGYPAGKMTVIPNGFDVREFAPRAAGGIRAELGGVGDIPLLGMVARWDEFKDHDNLLRALSLLADSAGESWTCALIGFGMTRENRELLALLQTHGVVDRVSLCGLRTDIPEVMSALDIHVLSSKSEAFPNVLAEAMACGTPCVATKVGDAGVIIGSTGWLVPPSNAAELARSLGEAIAEWRNPAEWQQRKAACRARIVDNYSIERAVAAYDQLWNELG